MDHKKLRSLQAPLKKQYKEEPEKALYILSAEGKLGTDISCRVAGQNSTIDAGLHPATGGDGSQACSGDMLLESLVACAGVTLKSVATVMSIEIEEGFVQAEGSLDFRGTMGVSKEVPVGLQEITLKFRLKTDAPKKKIEKLIELTERYCVIYQTLKSASVIKTVVEEA